MSDTALSSQTEPADLLFNDAGSVRIALGRSLGNWNPLRAHGTWVVNSHPKSGTLLLRNILLHFNHQFSHPEILFFDTFAAVLKEESSPRLYTTHIPYEVFKEAQSNAVNLRSILLLRHPCAIALALARSFYDINTIRPDHIYMRRHHTFEEITAKIISGYTAEGLRFSPLVDSLREFAIDWLDQVDAIIRFEDIVSMQASDDARVVDLFRPILDAMFGFTPPDAAARIRAGASPAISDTFSRTKSWAHRGPLLDDVYKLVPQEARNELRDAARLLGY